jgi:hypothetical protein
MATRLPPRTSSGRFRKRKSQKRAKLPPRKANGQFRKPKRRRAKRAR